MEEKELKISAKDIFKKIEKKLGLNLINESNRTHRKSQWQDAFFV